MTVIKVTTRDGQIFFCEQDTRVLVDRIPQIESTVTIEMSEEEYRKIPASPESAWFFE